MFWRPLQAELDYVGSITIEDEAAIMKPKVVFVDDENKGTKVTDYERHGELS